MLLPGFRTRDERAQIEQVSGRERETETEKDGRMVSIKADYKNSEWRAG